MIMIKTIGNQLSELEEEINSNLFFYENRAFN